MVRARPLAANGRDAGPALAAERDRGSAERSAAAPDAASLDGRSGLRLLLHRIDQRLDVVYDCRPRLQFRKWRHISNVATERF